MDRGEPRRVRLPAADGAAGLWQFMYYAGVTGAPILALLITGGAVVGSIDNQEAIIMKKLQVLGTGCPKCKKLAEAVDMAAQQLGLEYEIVKVTDIMEITGFGVMMTPALAIDGQVVFQGKVPGVDELKVIIGG